MGAKFYAQGEEKFKERLMLSGIKDVVTSGQDSTHLIPELVKGRGLRDFLGLNNKKQLMQMKFKKGDMFQPHQEKKKNSAASAIWFWFLCQEEYRKGIVESSSVAFRNQVCGRGVPMQWPGKAIV